MLHNLDKIRLFRAILWSIYPIALIFIYPLALLKKKNKGKLFFFFDRYAVGGAQRIHLDILESTKDVQKQMYFTRKSANEILKADFYSTPHAEIQDIHFWCDNLLIRLFTVHYYSFYLNRHEQGTILSSNSTFFYDMLPFLKKRLIKIELLHNFTGGKNGMEFFGLANHKLLTHRIVYDTYTLANIKKQYAEYTIESEYLQRILYIEPGVIIANITDKNYNQPLKIMYAGRGGAQKRIPLLDAAARICIEEKLPVEFHFVGDEAISELSSYVKEHSVLHGSISKLRDMYRIYFDCHAILMTSAYEGFPMLIKEGMANGCIPIVTALEGNKGHLKHMENAMLMPDPEDETKVVADAVNNIKTLINDNQLLQKLSQQCHDYAAKHFDKQEFNTAYEKLLCN